MSGNIAKKIENIEEYYILINKFKAVLGKFNIKDEDELFALIVGNGSSDEERSNAFTLDWKGNATFAGKVLTYGKKEVATKSEVTSMSQQLRGQLYPVHTDTYHTFNISNGEVWNRDFRYGELLSILIKSMEVIDDVDHILNYPLELRINGTEIAKIFYNSVGNKFEVPYNEIEIGEHIFVEIINCNGKECRIEVVFERLNDVFYNLYATRAEINALNNKLQMLSQQILNE